MRPHTSQRGYTLLEMIVSVGLFSVVMLVVTGAYLTLISLDRHARATNELVASLSFAVESMARSIRTGTAYSTSGGSSCGNGGSTRISFTDSQNQSVRYEQLSNGTIGQCLGGSSCESLHDPRIQIPAGGLCFYVLGVGTGDGAQPRAIIVIKGTMATDAGKTAQFAIQTSATQRLIEI